jgi:hypothetical protein
LIAPLAIALGTADWIRARHAEGTLAHPVDGDGLLTVAVEHDRSDMLQLLLDLGFDPDERKRVVSEDGVHESRGIPLDRCASRGNIALAEMLLARGADPNPKPGQMEPIATAYRKRSSRYPRRRAPAQMSRPAPHPIPTSGCRIACGTNTRTSTQARDGVGRSSTATRHSRATNRGIRAGVRLPATAILLHRGSLTRKLHLRRGSSNAYIPVSKNEQWPTATVANMAS